LYNDNKVKNQEKGHSKKLSMQLCHSKNGKSHRLGTEGKIEHQWQNGKSFMGDETKTRWVLQEAMKQQRKPEGTR